LREVLLSAQHIRKSFPNGNGGLLVLEDVSLQVNRGEFVCIVGPSGCGKTTLLRLLAGLMPPTSGEVFFEGQRLQQPRRRIGFVFQQANLMPWRTALQNIALPLELDGAAGVDVVSRARSLIELVGLEGFEDSYPHDLSGGMAQRVAIARALIHQPDILLLDEPFGALDALTREYMATELMRIWGARNVTILMVTHSISEAVLLADRVVVLSPRPANVQLDLPIDLARPRKLSMSHTADFGQLAAKVRGAIVMQNGATEPAKG
jgi:NitT/TauT family transport system ATP-binding protein